MTQLSIPASIPDLTPSWLTEALRDWLPPGARVSSVRYEPTGAAGNLSQLTRLFLDYEPGVSAAPSSVVVKRPSSQQLALRQAERFQLYRREVGFYSEAASASGVRVPVCYCALHADDGAFVLVLEDVVGVTGLSQASGCSPAQAAASVASLAALHSSWWESERLATFSWLPGRDAEPVRAWNETFLRRLPLFIERWTEHVEPGLGAVLQRMAANLEGVTTALYARPQTLAHGDFRVDNLLFSAGAAEPVVIDWQNCQRLPGAADLHYFLATNLGHELRRSEADAYLAFYYEGLRAGGVEGYSLDQLHEDFARATTWLAAFGVIGSAPVDPAVHDGNRQLVEQVHLRLLRSFVAFEGERFLRR